MPKQVKPPADEEPQGSRIDRSDEENRLDRLLRPYRSLGTLTKIVIVGATLITSVAAAAGVIQGAFDEPPPPPPPVRVLAELQRDPKIFERGQPDWTGYSYVIPREVRELSPPPRGLCRDRAEWAYGLGGADAGYTRAQVTIEGNSPGRVLIDGIEAIVETRQEPLEGVWAQCPVGGATGEPRRIQVDLNQRPPDAQYLEVGGEPVASPVVFTLKKGEAETFFIDAFATTCYCEWRVEFSLIAGAERRIVTVPANGDPPFRTTGTKNAKPFIWRNGSWTPG